MLKRYQHDQLNEIDAFLVDEWYDSLDKPGKGYPAPDAGNLAQTKAGIKNAINDHIRDKNKIRKLRYWSIPLSAAACLLICFSVILFLHRSKPGQEPNRVLADEVITTKVGEMKEIVLPDNSHVWLNAGGSVRYNAFTFTSKRTIYLDEGEAFFKVTKDPSHPFVVQTPKISTRVLGTSFDVKCYKELQYASVEVKTGRVEVKNNLSQQKVVLTPTQAVLCVNSTGQFSRNSYSLEEIGNWVSGDTFLKEADFAELKLTLHNRYGINLSARDPEILKYHYTINITKQEPMLETVKLICSIHNNHYRRTNNDVIIY